MGDETTIQHLEEHRVKQEEEASLSQTHQGLTIPHDVSIADADPMHHTTDAVGHHFDD